MYMYALPEPDSRDCPSGFSGTQDWPSSCYKLVQRGTSWSTARRRCLDLGTGSYLAEIDSEEEMQYLYRIFHTGETAVVFN